MPTILGVGDNNGSDTLTVTLTADQPPGTLVHVLHAAVLFSIPFSDNPSTTAVPSDSKDGVWEDANFAGTGDAVVGSSQDHVHVGSVWHGMQVGNTGLRVSGALLEAGDTVTVYWTDNAEGTSQMAIIAIVVAFNSMDTQAVTQYDGGLDAGHFVGVTYGNGNAGQLMLSAGSFDGKTVTWSGAALDMPAPSSTCRMLTAAAGYPASSGWTPAVGTTVAEHQSADGRLSLAVTCSSAQELTFIEPGGAWGGPATLATAVNYQFAGPLGLQSWQKF